MTTTTYALRGEDLLALQKEKGSICVSVIVPTHRLSPERRVDPLEIRRAMEKAKELLRYKYSPQQALPLAVKLDELYDEIDFTHNADGLGFFVSPRLKFAARFPFPVEEKVMVGDNFELRDLLYNLNYTNPYLALLLSEKGARLFEGSGGVLHEIRDRNFPNEYEEEFAYERPSRSNSYAGQSHVKSFEKDKSAVQEFRLSDFFHDTDNKLKDYISGDTPLVIIGPEKELSWFRNITAHSRLIAGSIHGSYHYAGLPELAELVWPVMRSFFEKEKADLLKVFAEKLGEGLGTSGIQEVWRASMEGRALILLVEKDYRCPGFVIEEEYHLFLRPPALPHKVLADAVDDLMEIVIEKNGQVIFVDNGQLRDYQRVALIMRY